MARKRIDTAELPEASRRKTNKRDPSDGQIKPSLTIPSKDHHHPLRDEEPNTLLGKQLKTNELGLTYDSSVDDCFHLNVGWKGGCCTIAGNVACPYMEGGQSNCTYHVPKAEIDKLSRDDRKALNFGHFKMPPQEDKYTR